MSLTKLKAELRILTNDVLVLENVVLEKKHTLGRTVAKMQARCTHPDAAVKIYRSYGERTRECFECGKEW